MVECVLFSPLFFVLLMKMILLCAEDNTYKKTVPSMKTFIDEINLIVESRSHIEQKVTRLQEFFK